MDWKTLTSQEIAEMRDAEFTSDLMLLALEGGKATSQGRLDAAYKRFEDEFPRAETCTKRVVGVMDVLNHIFEERASVNRLTKRMWVYSFFDAIQRVRLGGTIGHQKFQKENHSQNPEARCACFEHRSQSGRYSRGFVESHSWRSQRQTEPGREGSVSSRPLPRLSPRDDQGDHDVRCAPRRD